MISPLGKTISTPNTRSRVLPYFSTFEPPALVDKTPPIVAEPRAPNVRGNIKSFSFTA